MQLYSDNDTSHKQDVQEQLNDLGYSLYDLENISGSIERICSCWKLTALLGLLMNNVVTIFIV